MLRSQDTPFFDSLHLPTVKPSAKLDNETLTHLVGLHDALRERSNLSSAGSEDVRRANGEVTSWVAGLNGYLEEVEAEARNALASSGYTGEGPFSSRNLLDLSASAGFELHPVEDMPSFARSIIDLDQKRVYIAQRDALRTRQARKAVLQTLAGFLLGHERDPDLDTFLRQRVETAYFAAAVLAPEDAVIARLGGAKDNHDIDVEDVKELFYISYEMAAWRTVNLATRHLGIRTHLIVSDSMGTVVKAYANDEAPIPRDDQGGMETQRLCRRWGARITFDSAERYGTHNQYTDTPEGTFFCTTHVEAGREPGHAVTVGVPFARGALVPGAGHREPADLHLPRPGVLPDCGAGPAGEVVGQGHRLGSLAEPDPGSPRPRSLSRAGHARGSRLGRVALERLIRPRSPR